MRTVRLSAIQYKPPKGQPERARTELVALVERAAAGGAQLVVAPEMSVTGYVWLNPAQIQPHAEPADGPTYRALAPVAERHGCWITAGIAECQDGSLYNSAIVVDHHGRLVDCYRKVCLFDIDYLWARAGRGRPVYDTPFGRVAPGICMDLNDDRFTAFLECERPDILAFNTNWLDQGFVILPYWRERLGEWHGWFVAANTWGAEGRIRFYGNSAILNPARQTLALAGREGNEIIMAEARL
ncbi:MAG TPA: carbon-nitrogen hydrolase family protein [Candidatus Xenobia bacterium]